MAKNSDIIVMDTLIERGLITEENKQTALASTDGNNSSLNYLTRSRLVSQTDLLSAVATVENYDFIDLSKHVVDRTIAHKISAEQARQLVTIPYKLENDVLYVAVPLNKVKDLQLKDDLRTIVKVRTVRFAVAVKQEIIRAIEGAFRAEEELHQIGKDVGPAEETTSESLDDFTEINEESKIVRFVDLAIEQAIADGASDIHFEPDENELRIRYRIDGVLQDISSTPRSIVSEITSRVKILSDLDIAERRKPQDGRLSINYRGSKIDLRVATLPTVWGEKIVMRILDNSQASFELSKLGFSEVNLERFTSAYTKPYGMILVTGPTGSGKSTTLYAALNKIATSEINVVTVEDPVEYRVPRINQVQVNVKAGLTFAAALRSILRGDPDVVLVGEIRDKETANIAMEAGLTGHLVLSTLHTNDAASSVTRLTEMGVEPFLVSSVVEAVIAQRLVRKLCSNCKEKYEPTLFDVQKAGFTTDIDKELPDLYRPIGCRECAQTGYKGRMAIHEVLLRNDEIEKLTVENAGSTTIRDKAVETGMITLKEDGWLKVRNGDTSIAEILRVVA